MKRDQLLESFGFDISMWDDATKKDIFGGFLLHIPILILFLFNLTNCNFWLKIPKIKISQEWCSDSFEGIYFALPGRQKITIESHSGKSSYDMWVNDDRDCVVNGILYSIDSGTRSIQPIVLN